MSPPDRQGSFANSAIWCCTLMAIAALTVWRFEIWPVTSISTETGQLRSSDQSEDPIAVAPITVATVGDETADEAKAEIEPVANTSDEVPPPAQLAKLELDGPLPPIPQPHTADWKQNPLPDDRGSLERRTNKDTPARLPTGGDFGGSGLFPEAKQAPAVPPEQLKPVPLAEPVVRPVDGQAGASALPANPFTDSVTEEPLGEVKMAHFEPEIPAEVSDARLTAIDTDIQAGQFLSAHRALSKLYWDEPSLREAIQERIATTARSIYFDPAQHYMPAYVVQPNQSLADIAGQYKIPQEYLLRLNGMNSPGQLASKSELKVIRGPFAAVVDLADQSLTIHAHGYYVRRCACIAPAETTTPGTFRVLSEEGDWLALDDGQGNPSSLGIQAVENLAADAVVPPGTIQISREDALLARELLETGAELQIRK